MNKGHIIIASMSIVWLATGACKKEEAPVVDLGYGYFPTSPGAWIEYQVDSLRVRRVGQSTPDSISLSYPLREELTENFADPEGRPAQRIVRYTRDANNNWLPKDVWWQVREGVRAERTEENLRRVKLVFPPRTTTFWNTNARNTAEEFELSYSEVDVPWSINGMSFDSTLLVVGTYPSNLFFTKTYRERYAKGVGLIYREVDSVNNQFSQGYDRWYIKQVITGHGH